MVLKKLLFLFFYVAVCFDIAVNDRTRREIQCLRFSDFFFLESAFSPKNVKILNKKILSKRVS